jgi:hypothetical protein
MCAEVISDISTLSSTSREVKSTQNIYRIGETESAYWILAGKRLGEKLLGGVKGEYRIA